MLPIHRILRHLRRDERGTSLLEFAFTVPIFAVMAVGVADLGRGFLQRYTLQQAVNRTLEMANLGLVEIDGVAPSDYTFLKAEAATAASVPLANVALDQWLECNGTRKTFNGKCAAGEQTARYVTLTINSSFTPSFGTAGYPGAVNGVVPISVASSLRVQ